MGYILIHPEDAGFTFTLGDIAHNGHGADGCGFQCGEGGFFHFLYGYARKQSTYYVNKVYSYWSIADLRADLIERARQMAAARRRRDNRNERHPWENMTDEELWRTSGLILTDEQVKG